VEEREEAIDKAKMGQWSAEEGWKGKAKCVGQWLFA
jgi:hypothetical protein